MQLISLPIELIISILSPALPFRVYLHAYQKSVNWDWAGRTDPKIKWDLFHLKSERFDPDKHEAATCRICTVAKWTPIGKPKISPVMKPKVVPKGEISPPPLKKLIPKKICHKCKQETGPGLPHPCTLNSSKKNLSQLISQETATGQEQVLGESLKNLVAVKGGEPGKELRLTGLRGGNPLSVTVGKSTEGPDPLLIDSELMARLQKKLRLPEQAILKLAREFKAGGVKFEPHIREDLQKLSHCLDEFYTVEKLEFIEKKQVKKKSVTSTVMLDLVYVKDPVAFIDHVIKKRGLNRKKVLVRLGLDGGQGSFKVVASIFETDSDPKKEDPGNLLTGANRLLVLALAQGLQEQYENLRIVVEKLQLNAIECVYACDLKLINCFTGISSHSGKFACPYCEGEMTLQPGLLRTFGSLARRLADFEREGSKMKQMQRHKNVIHKCLLDGDPNIFILFTIPLPELHLMMGVVNWGVEVLYKVVDATELKQRMRTKGISVHGYHGGGLDGGNSNLFLKHLSFLSEGTSVQAAPIFGMLSQFKVVVKGCFSLDLAITYRADIDRFNTSVHNLLQHSNEVLKISLNPTWKVHIVVCHLKQFLDEKKVGLGIYCEQTSEAAHSTMKPTIQRFKRKADHELHGPRLKRAASALSAVNL